MGRNYRVAADIGGTFTDIVYQDSETGACGATKVLSTPDNPALAVLTGISQVVGDSDAIGFFVHGTTVGLNALLTRRGARVALVTNENFRDIYTIQGNDRGEIFSIRWNKPAPLTPVEHTYTLAGRMSAEGKEVDPLHLPDLDRLVDAAADGNYEA
ncbi:MAG: hydantoinase/oxoprolinase family protein, partial [Boseongicola sp. SB0670_bin_30]|nr:hydantoinase/oxoprolinase family protein [Boseongicola sp. SB0670_bin_30]